MFPRLTHVFPPILIVMELLCCVLALSSKVVADVGSPAVAARQDGQGDRLPEGAVSRCGTTRLRYHTGRVAFDHAQSLAYSPDGKTLAVGSSTVVRVFNAATGQPFGPGVIEDASHPVAFSPDGRWLAATIRGSVKKLCLWEVATRKAYALDVRQEIVSMAFSADATCLASGGRNGDVALIDLKARAVKARWQFSTEVEVEALALSPDGRFLAAGGGHLQRSDENDVQVWDVSAEKVVARLKGHQKRVMSLAFVLGGKALASSGLDNTIRFWDVTKKEQVGSINTPVTSITASADGKVLASHHSTSVVSLWNPDGGKKVGEFTAGDKPLCALAFSPDGKRLATGGYTRTVRIWEVVTGKEVLPLPGHQEAIVTVAFSPDGKTLASRSEGTTLRFWEPASGKQLRQFRLGRWQPFGGIRGDCALAFSRDGTRLATLGATAIDRHDPSLHVWALPSGDKLATFSEPRHHAHCLALSPDGEVVAVTGRDGVRLWSLSSKEVVRHLANENARVLGPLSVAFSPDGRLLATGKIGLEKESKIQLWDWSTGMPVRAIVGHDRQVVSMAFSPGGHALATCGGGSPSGDARYDDPVIRLWEVSTGTFIHAFIGHDGPVGCAALSRDGRLLASAGQGDNTVRVWNAFTGDELAKFKGHIGPVLSVAFSPDGKRLASGSADTTILIWDTSHLKAEPPATDATPENLAKLWDTLRQHEAAKPFKAIWSLVGAGDKAVALLDKELHPVPAPDAAKLRTLIAGLDSEEPSVRDKASEGLAKLGPLAEPALREALKSRSAEVQRRAHDLLDKLRAREVSDDELRQGRVVLALELIGTSAARDLLHRLADGAAGAPLTRDAAAALKRLSRGERGGGK
jgi:WD40 repeat protein